MAYDPDNVALLNALNFGGNFTKEKTIEPSIPIVLADEVAEVTPELLVAVKAMVTKKQEVMRQIGNILSAHGSKESDIPNNHAYWDLLNLYRGM